MVCVRLLTSSGKNETGVCASAWGGDMSFEKGDTHLGKVRKEKVWIAVNFC